MNQSKSFPWLIILLFILVITSCETTSGPDADETQTNDTNYLNESDYTVSEVLSKNSKDHDDEDDYIWDDSSVFKIALFGNSITINGSGATVEGGKVTITTPGTYEISGTLSDGQIVVNSTSKGVVRLILNGTNIVCSDNSPVYIKEADKVLIWLAGSSENYLTDGKTYVVEDDTSDEPNAAIFSMADLTISGTGSLNVKGNNNDGIASKDGLIISGGNISVYAADDGIRGKDYLIVKNGNINVVSGGDGLKSDNETDGMKGYALIKNGTINITSSGDAITAATDLMISDGQITIISGGGSSSKINGDVSSKGIKSSLITIIEGGTISVNSSDDAFHSNYGLAINGGTIDLSTGDDGIHSDSLLVINGGIVRVNKSYEGLESRTKITINDGEIHINSSDDGINIASGEEGAGGPPRPGTQVNTGNRYLYINGGYIAVNADGDGIDINGSIVMTGGVVLVHGPTGNMNGAIDYDSSFKISGGFLLAVGSSGMAQAPGTSSTQNSILANFNTSQSAGKMIHLQSGDGTEIFSFTPLKKFQSVAFSSPDIKTGSTYELFLGGSSTGTNSDGLYTKGNYTPGTKYSGFTVSGVVTKIN